MSNFKDSVLLMVGNLGEAILDGMLKNGVNVSALVRTEDKAIKLNEFYPSLSKEVFKKTIDIDKKTVIVAVKPNGT